MATKEEAVLYELQDQMVRRAERLVLDLNLRPKEGAEKGKTQASRALEVVQTAGSLSVFVNWLRYQAGREKSADLWTRRAGKHTTLAKGITEELAWLQNQVAAKMADATQAEKSKATMSGATLFLGYFRRALIGADYLAEINLDER